MEDAPLFLPPFLKFPLSLLSSIPLRLRKALTHFASSSSSHACQGVGGTDGMDRKGRDGGVLSLDLSLRPKDRHCTAVDLFVTPSSSWQFLVLPSSDDRASTQSCSTCNRCNRRSAANEWLSGSVPLGEIHPNSLKRLQLFFHGVYRWFA